MAQTVLARLVRLIVQKYDPERIVLFGSRAKGEADQYSDYDFIVIKDTRKPFLKRLKTFPALPVQADVFIYTPEEFHKMRREGNLFLAQALRSSRVLYEKSGRRS